MVTAFSFPPFVASRSLGWDYMGVERHHKRKSELSKTITMSNSRELPMPTVSKLSSLSQAHATLLHCWTKISKFAYEYPSPSTPSSRGASPVIEDRQHFQRWLEQWEAAFTAFLTNAMPSMSNEDVTESRVLKANHLACTILVNDRIPSPRDAPEVDFHAIVELAGAVLRIRHLADSPQERKSESSPSMTQLDVKEPLHVVASRCSQESIRARAMELLSHFHPASSA